MGAHCIASATHDPSAFLGPRDKPEDDVVFLLALLAAPHILKQMLNHEPHLDRAFHALADPGRRAMLERLTKGPASVSQLAEPLEMTLSAVVQHLAVLEDSGLVRTQKFGRVRTCQIEPKALSMAEQWINERRTMWERRLDLLGEYLNATKHEEQIVDD